MDEEELAMALAAAVRGDAAAFGYLWDRLQPSRLRHLHVTVGHAADDMASETWLQAARDLRGFVGGARGSGCGCSASPATVPSISIDAPSVAGRSR